jgi:hypothetical protein
MVWRVQNIQLGLLCQVKKDWTFPKIFRRAERRMAAEVAAYLLVLRVKV